MAARVVLDASAVVEIVLRGQRAAAISDAVGTAQAASPDVLNLEVLSALRRLERAGRLSSARAAVAVRDVVDAAIERVPTQPLLPGTWELRENLSAYDASYVALARAMECPILTADQRLARAPALGVPLVLF